MQPFKIVTPFAHGFGRLMIDDLDWYVDKYDNVIMCPSFVCNGYFDGEVAVAEFDDGYRLVDKNSKILCDGKYYFFRPKNMLNSIVTKYLDTLGIVDDSIDRQIYDYIFGLKDGRIKVSFSDRVVYLEIDTKLIRKSSLNKFNEFSWVIIDKNLNLNINRLIEKVNYNSAEISRIAM